MLDVSAPRFCVVNLGCKVNRVESDSLAALLMARGGRAVDQSLADVIIVNSCTVTGEADKKTRKAVRAALRANARAEVIVTGCGVSVDAGAFRAIDERVETVERAELFAALAEKAPDDNPTRHSGLSAKRTAGQSSQAGASDVSRTRPAANARDDEKGPVGRSPFGYGSLLRLGEGFRSRVNIKVQDGCDHACTYCIVHVARGAATSASFSDVVAEARAYFDHGAKELVLTGIDLGSYREGGKTLADLVTALIEQADIACPPGERPARIRASSVEPKSIDERFIELLSSSGGRLCRHLHLPLQSGSTRVLREMARPYSADYFAELVRGLYERVPQLALTTDIICGFPGETDDDFRATMDIARQCRFSKIHVFPYSKRAGTPAAAMDDQVADAVKATRAAELRQLSDELRRNDLLRRRGTEELAFVEPGCALTESYHEIAAPENTVVGELVSVRL